MKTDEFNQLLDDYLTGDLQGERLEAFERALEVNPEFQRELDDHLKLAELMQSEETPAAPPTLRQNLMRTIRSEAPAPKSSPLKNFLRLLQTAFANTQLRAATAVCLIAIVGYNLLPQLNLNEGEIMPQVSEEHSGASFDDPAEKPVREQLAEIRDNERPGAADAIALSKDKRGNVWSVPEEEEKKVALYAIPLATPKATPLASGLSFSSSADDPRSPKPFLAGKSDNRPLQARGIEADGLKLDTLIEGQQLADGPKVKLGNTDEDYFEESNADENADAAKKIENVLRRDKQDLLEDLKVKTEDLAITLQPSDVKTSFGLAEGEKRSGFLTKELRGADMDALPKIGMKRSEEKKKAAPAAPPQPRPMSLGITSESAFKKEPGSGGRARKMLLSDAPASDPAPETARSAASEPTPPSTTEFALKPKPILKSTPPGANLLAIGDLEREDLARQEKVSPQLVVNIFLGSTPLRPTAAKARQATSRSSSVRPGAKSSRNLSQSPEPKRLQVRRGSGESITALAVPLGSARKPAPPPSPPLVKNLQARLQKLGITTRYQEPKKVATKKRHATAVRAAPPIAASKVGRELKENAQIQEELGSLAKSRNTPLGVLHCTAQGKDAKWVLEQLEKLGIAPQSAKGASTTPAKNSATAETNSSYYYRSGGEQAPTLEKTEGALAQTTPIVFELILFERPTQ